MVYLAEGETQCEYCGGVRQAAVSVEKKAEREREREREPRGQRACGLLRR